MHICFVLLEDYSTIVMINCCYSQEESVLVFIVDFKRGKGSAGLRTATAVVINLTSCDKIAGRRKDPVEKEVMLVISMKLHDAGFFLCHTFSLPAPSLCFGFSLRSPHLLPPFSLPFSWLLFALSIKPLSTTLTT